MLNSKGFDEWAGEYDKSISKYSKGYPFEGYYDVLGFIHNSINEVKGKNILDLGVGTGLLSYELYKKGANIYGIDFSEKMIGLAKNKMSDAKFYHYNLKNGLPDGLNNHKFDYIISSYVIHHLDNKEKELFIKKLKKYLMSNGKIIIGDIAFKTEKDKEKCCYNSGDKWDNDEIYIIAEKIQEQLNQFETTYTQICQCAGVLEVL